MCEFCDIVNGKEQAETLYEDEDIIAVLHLKPAYPGQIIIFTKEHHTIIEQVPDPVVQNTFKIANKLSTVLFETLNIQGTNIIVQNGTAAGQTIPHFSVNIVPRSENDGLNFQWATQQLSKDEMETALLELKSHTETIHPDMFQKQKQTIEIKSEKPATVKLDSKKEDYLVRQIIRIPKV